MAESDNKSTSPEKKTTPAKKSVPSLKDLTSGAANKSGDQKEDTASTSVDTKSTKSETVVRPEDIKPPVDNTEKPRSSQVDDSDKADKPVLSKNVVGTIPDKTPSELAAETPGQTAARYGIDQSITDEDADNPNVQVYRDTHVNQVPSGTHLHPDIAKDLLNRGISEQHTDNAAVKRTVTEYYHFADSSEHNDKM